MAYPSNSPQRWAFDASADTADPGAFADIGFVADDPARYDWLNYTLENHGEWLTYIAGFTPSDGVWNFREWECPDDSSYDITWDAGTPGALDITGESVSISGNVGGCSLGSSAGGGAFSRLLVSTTTSGVFAETNRAGWFVMLRTVDPAGGVDDAGLTVDADSGDVTLYSDYGSVEIPRTTVTSKAAAYGQTLIPALCYVERSGTTGNMTPGTGVGRVLAINASTSAEVLGYFDIGHPCARTAPSTTDSLEEVIIYHNGGTGSTGGVITFTLYKVQPDGTFSAIASGTGTISEGDPAGTVVINPSPAPLVEGGSRVFCEVSCNGTAVTAGVTATHASFASTNLR